MHRFANYFSEKYVVNTTLRYFKTPGKTARITSYNKDFTARQGSALINVTQTFENPNGFSSSHFSGRKFDDKLSRPRGKSNFEAKKWKIQNPALFQKAF